jgi:hypothetical protein
MSACAGDRQAALELYVWNTVVAARFYGPLQAIEVAVRNACDRELSRHFGRQWYRLNSFWSIDPRFADEFATARQTLIRAGKPVTAGRIIAQYSLGFWTKLFRKGPRGRYVTSLWGPVLRHVFNASAPKARTIILNELEAVRLFRNRVAHFEPLHQRALSDDLSRLHRIASWIDPDLQAWVEAYDCVTVELRNRPLIGHDAVRGRSPWPITTF